MECSRQVSRSRLSAWHTLKALLGGGGSLLPWHGAAPVLLLLLRNRIRPAVSSTATAARRLHPVPQRRRRRRRRERGGDGVVWGIVAIITPAAAAAAAAATFRSVRRHPPAGLLMTLPGEAAVEPKDGRTRVERRPGGGISPRHVGLGDTEHAPAFAPERAAAEDLLWRLDAASPRAVGGGGRRGVVGVPRLEFWGLRLDGVQGDIFPHLPQGASKAKGVKAGVLVRVQIRVHVHVHVRVYRRAEAAGLV